ncbi:MAG: NAD(P)-dependent glycerol-1-phosphate dehydrogenase [Desulfurococcales archaeon]|nr:NAD(P)-dependent glycerol-1-phosphate dehydrogenase [Desulfurococcales archaeon]MCE4605264.1 NAD(P)-dependent glycerol-1-phosphate dehydrogenase [Desulfurococcales archaeon]
MDRHVIDLPRKVVVGRGVIGEVGGYASQLYARGSSILVVTGPRVYSLYYPRVRQSLEEAGFSVESVVIIDATVDTAEKVASQARESGVRALVGLGGGRSIDIAKYASSHAGAGLISLPTVASHDGITSPFASLKGFDRPISRRAKPPDIIILDVDVISKAPRRYNIAGFGDLIGKFTAVRDWRLAHKLRGEYYGEYAASLALMSARHVASYAREIGLGTTEGYRVLLEALVSSGVAMCIAGSSRPASGSEHLFAHALSIIAKRKPLHGEAVGVGTIMMSYIHGMKWRRIKRLMQEAGAPTTAREIGVEDEEVIEALVLAAKIRPERYTILGEKGLTRDAAEKVAKDTGVII